MSDDAFADELRAAFEALIAEAKAKGLPLPEPDATLR